jgi:hypothetical protein
MSNLAKPLAEALRDAPEAARLLARWEATQRAARCIAPLCQSLAAGFDPLVPGRCEWRDGVLILTAASTAQSAKLRQAIPRLQALLASEANRVYEIRVRVEPGMTVYPEQGSNTPSSLDDAWLKPSASASETVGKLALTIKNGDLKDAVERLAATLRRRARR